MFSLLDWIMLEWNKVVMFSPEAQPTGKAFWRENDYIYVVKSDVPGFISRSKWPKQLPMAEPVTLSTNMSFFSKVPDLKGP